MPAPTPLRSTIVSANLDPDQRLVAVDLPRPDNVRRMRPQRLQRSSLSCSARLRIGLVRLPPLDPGRLKRWHRRFCSSGYNSTPRMIGSRVRLAPSVHFRLHLTTCNGRCSNRRVCGSSAAARVDMYRMSAIASLLRGSAPANWADASARRGTSKRAGKLFWSAAGSFGEDVPEEVRAASNSTRQAGGSSYQEMRAHRGELAEPGGGIRRTRSKIFVRVPGKTPDIVSKLNRCRLSSIVAAFGSIPGSSSSTRIGACSMGLRISRWNALFPCRARFSLTHSLFSVHIVEQSSRFRNSRHRVGVPIHDLRDHVAPVPPYLVHFGKSG